MSFWIFFFVILYYVAYRTLYTLYFLLIIKLLLKRYVGTITAWWLIINQLSNSKYIRNSENKIKNYISSKFFIYLYLQKKKRKKKNITRKPRCTWSIISVFIMGLVGPANKKPNPTWYRFIWISMQKYILK